MRGQSEPIVAVLMMSIIIGVIFLVYTWGAPIIQRSQEKSVLYRSEEFLKRLNDNIKNVANNGGSKIVNIDVPDIIIFTTAPGYGMFTVETEVRSSIYTADIWTSFTGNTCDRNEIGKWMNETSDILCAFSREGSGTFRTTYILTYRDLTANGKTYRIDLIGPEQSGGRTHNILIRQNRVYSSGDTVIREIKISIL